jgi:glycosyltransferase involved in cell wall biosynthesis
MVALAAGLPRGEFQPQVIVLGRPPSRGRLVQRLQTAGIPLEFLGARRKWKFRAIATGLAARLREHPPDLLQCFLHHADVTGAVAAHRAGVTRVVTGIRVAERRFGIRRWLERATDRYVARHVCVSETVAEFAARVVRLPASKLVTIPNGVDVQAFLAAAPLALGELGVPSGSKVLLYVGRLDRQKRLGWLVRRMPGIARRHDRVHLVLAGEGPQEKRLRRLAMRLGVRDRVHFLGWRGDVPRVLAAADVLVLTSAWEGMPNAVLEAMAAAKPVVATEAEGVAEILGPLAREPATQLLAADDVEAFADTVVQLTQDNALARQVGLANRQRVQEEFTVARMVERYCELYRQLLHE